MSDFIHKDEVLDRLAATANVAQFVSFGTGGDQRFSRIHGHSPNFRFASIPDAVQALLAASPEQSVNVRSYELASPKSREFIYGIKSVPDVVTAVRRLSGDRLFTIINETIDIE